MSKGQSGLLTKFQTKLEYTTSGIIGELNGFEVFTEVVLRLANVGVQDTHSITVQGRLAIDLVWYDIGTLIGEGTDTFHISSYDYIRFNCDVFDVGSLSTTTLRGSAFFHDGMFTVNAVKDMQTSIENKLTDIGSTICDLKQEIKIINRQIELITDHEEDEVK